MARTQGGPGVLADDFFRIAHSDSTGRPRLHARAAGVGLGAALLAELVLGRQLTVEDSQLVVVNQQPPDDALAHTVLEQLVAEPHHRTVRTWLDFLSRTAPAAVGDRLVRAGQATRRTSRWRRGTFFVPTDMSAAAWPEARLRMLLGGRGRWTWPDVVLVGLVGATGLARQVLWDVEPATRAHRAEVLGWLAPDLRELVAQTEAAVGDAVLSHRT
ncbi:MAG TPA: GPP34 family phosphoprotein [Micromonosporaceae bacterium]|nr:GPP34 family phosphoprotein [Micromonosporaceae bacterium]